jgi:hypothetical protein
VSSAEPAHVTYATAAPVSSASACLCIAARRLPASAALAKTIITRRLMTFSLGMDGAARHGGPYQTLACPRKTNADVAMD